MEQKFFIYESTINEWQFKEEAGEIASIPLMLVTDDPLEIFGSVFSVALMSDTSKEAYSIMINRTIVVHDGYTDPHTCKWVSTACTPYSFLSFMTAWWKKEGTGRDRI